MASDTPPTRPYLSPEKQNLLQNYLRQGRKEHGISAAELGQKAGLAESTISLFERGKRKLSSESFQKLQIALYDIIEARIAEEARRRDEEERKDQSGLVRLTALMGMTPEGGERWVQESVERDPAVLQAANARLEAEIKLRETEIKLQARLIATLEETIKYQKQVIDSFADGEKK